MLTHIPESPSVHEPTESPGFSLVLYRSDLERQPKSLVFFSLNDWIDKSRPVERPDLRSVIWESELELPDEGNQKRVYLGDTKRNISVVKRQLSPRNGEVNTNANLHPMQFLTPPEKVALLRHQPYSKGQIYTTYRFPYTPTDGSGLPAASSHRSGRQS